MIFPMFFNLASFNKSEYLFSFTNYQHNENTTKTKEICLEIKFKTLIYGYVTNKFL